jgi:hypothetical protein
VNYEHNINNNNLVFSVSMQFLFYFGIHQIYASVSQSVLPGHVTGSQKIVYFYIQLNATQKLPIAIILSDADN